MKIGIIGGGISGLYSAYKLCQNSNNEVYIYERGEKMGGRIYTLNVSDYIGKKTDNIYIKEGLSQSDISRLKKIKYECGAGRFTKTQKPLMNLLKELGIDEKDFIEIGSNSAYRTECGLIEKDNKCYLELIRLIVSKALECDNLETTSLFNFITYFLSDSDIDFLKYACCYSFEFFNMNMVDAIERLTFEFLDNPQFYVLRGGLSRIIHELLERCKKMDNCHLYNDNNIVSITEVDDKYMFNLNDNLLFDNIIVTVDPNSLRLLKMFNPLEKYIKSIKDHDLTRIYIVLEDTKEARELFKMIDKRFTTNNILRYVTPVDPKNLLLMIYVEGEYGELWREKFKSGLLDMSIESELYKLFSKRVSIMYRGYHFWKGGVHYNEKAINRDGLVKPFKKKRIYLANSAYSCLGWMSCSIEMVDKVIKKMDS